MINKTKGRKLNWSIVLGLTVLHVGALFAPFMFSWKALWVSVFIYWLTTGLGICFCYHRLLTHRSFRCPKWLEYFTTVMGTLTTQGGPISWVATHRLHHANSDQENDPHSPRHGFWWAHMLWFVYHDSILEDKNVRAQYAPELAKDPVHHFIDEYNWIGPWILGVVLYLWGGLPFVVWGVFLRTVISLHITWSTNSATHKWGYKTYESNDDSTNLWWMGILGFGEGWHNNHHAFQYSARHGLQWWEIDMTYAFIRLLSMVKIVDSVKLPSLTALKDK